jgi:hypothetical protein
MSAAPRLAPGTGVEDGALVRVEFPDGLVVPDHLLTEEARLGRVRAALSVRICAGLYSGSMRSLADANGCSVQSLSKRAREMAGKLGIQLHFLSDGHRHALSTAQTERWRSIKRRTDAAAAFAQSGMSP